MQVEWITVFRRIVAAQRELFSSHPAIADRTVYEGIGEGGDRALALDRRCEDAVFAELEALHRDGHEFTVISEERGEVAFGNGDVHVVVDPLDGSLNARRTIPAHSLSIAVASGPSLGDVEIAYVYDFGADEEFVARRGSGATLGGAALRAVGPGYGLEVVGLESTQPELILPLIESLAGRAYRLRSVGSIAISLCYVAGGRFDGMLTARACRSVDAAAGILVAMEAGAPVEVAGWDLASAPLSLDARYHVAAALDREMLDTLLDVQTRAPAAATP